jgi:hypothetical protein
VTFHQIRKPKLLVKYAFSFHNAIFCDLVGLYFLNRKNFMYGHISLKLHANLSMELFHLKLLLVS